MLILNQNTFFIRNFNTIHSFFFEMSLLSQVFSLALNFISFPFAEPDGNTRLARSDDSIFPFDVLRNMPEPCTTHTFEMGKF